MLYHPPGPLLFISPFSTFYSFLLPLLSSWSPARQESTGNNTTATATTTTAAAESAPRTISIPRPFLLSTRDIICLVLPLLSFLPFPPNPWLGGRLGVWSLHPFLASFVHRYR
ncbi:uncharacterized protein F4807DRAFT_183918 [Annulohypoxylon truncatum]|uniref:uncharacterized protein n=1 Tax=Annulohypoxylon truncatum TaxID=327061 RepID=UPI002007F4C2|nr:uncharacterized protein F4807DRAFT_183918 [Annulohypoxylon truncatum]KAI1207309.1 hypothetical protein F4807DRAFT_183918 [Annulohypoxylon truncatum]